MLRTAWLLLALLLVAPQVWGGQVYLVPAEGGEPTQLTKEEGLDCGSPSWSHDGKLIAFDAWPGNGDFSQLNIYTIPSEGGPTQLVGQGSVADWSPDDRQILCHGHSNGIAACVMNADGTGWELLLKNVVTPQWQTGGKAFAAVHFNQGLVCFNLETGESESLIATSGLRPGFGFCPKTNRYLIVHERLGKWRVLLCSYDAELMRWDVATRLTSPERIGRISWAPDGRRAVTEMGETDSTCRLFVFDADSKDAPVPVPGIPGGWVCCNPRWSPGGKQIAFVRLEPKQPD